MRSEPTGGGVKETKDSPILEIVDLHTHISTDDQVVRAVDGVSLSCYPSRTLAIVGESGSGKTMTFLSVIGVLPAGARIEKGVVNYNGRDLLKMPKAELRRLRGPHIAMLFQDSLTGLNPAFTIGTQVADIFRQHERLGRREAWRRTLEVLDQVHIPNVKTRARYYPHQLSGGMRQRVMIAMGIALRPRVLIADEPSTALDVTIQAQILDLLDDLRNDLGMALVIITHDLGVVARYADDVAVMYAGRIVEYADVGSIYRRSVHPYTVALRRSIPRPDEDLEVLESIPGQPAGPSALPVGCAFHPRCFLSGGRRICRDEVPQIREFQGHLTACHFAEELADGEQLRPAE